MEGGGVRVGRSTYLVTKRVTADDDGLDPTGDRFRYPLNDDGFTEDGSVEDVSDLLPGDAEHGGRRYIGSARDRSAVSQDRRKEFGRKSVERTVPLGLLHICFNLNSSTRASSGVMVAHLTPTLYFLMASAESTVTWSSVCRHRATR